MPGRLRRPIVAATTALLLTPWLAGCSGGSDDAASDPAPSASPTESSTPSSPAASPTPSPSRSPRPEPPKPPPAKDTVAGREAFARFVIDSWGYALSTNDANALLDLSAQSGPCEGCPELRDELQKRKKQGWYVDFPGADIVTLQVTPGDQPGVQVARATIDVPRSTSYFEDGEVRNINEAHKGAAFEVQMRLDGKRYALLAYRVG
jgi:hypothetical protein